MGKSIASWHALFLLPVALASNTGFGWGSYGHEQINRAAALSLGNHPMGKWMAKSLPAIQRLAVTPDYDWKHVGLAPDDPSLNDARNRADRYEHPLHYFEADAFLLGGVVNPITAKLLQLDLYGKVYPSYVKLRAANEEYVVSIDSEKALADISKPTAKEITSHGTAPWRIAQLWKLGVNALKKKDYKHGLAYLGAMGHYVGDCSQPFHGTLDYDGKAHEPEAGGIHAAYETKLFDVLAKAKGSTWDKNAKIWLNFDATEAAVVKATGEKMALLPDIKGSDISGITVGAIALVVKTNPYIIPLEDVFAEAIQEENEDAATIKVATIKAFMKKTITVGKNPKATVVATATDELSNGSALLAKLWMAAYDEVRLEPGFDLSAAPKVTFTEALVLENYPKPTYLPQVKKEQADEDGDEADRAVAGAAISRAAKAKAPLFQKNRETGDAHFPPQH